MSVELKVPSVGESITEVVIGQWLVQEGDHVALDQPVVEIETDKVNSEVPAPAAGRLVKQLKAAGDEATVGEVIALIEPGEAPAGGAASQAAPAPAASAAAPSSEPRVMPAARAAMAAKGLSAGDVQGSGPGGRVTKEDVARAAAPAPTPPAAAPAPAPSEAGDRATERVAMTPLRKRIAARLVQSQNDAALLTTFNEVDMSPVMALRSRYKQAFIDKHGVKLGFMSFFVKASIEALKACPALNARIDGDEIVYHDYFDIGVAVGSGKGLVVPVIRNAERLSFAEIEKTIGDFAVRARERKLTLDELQGGTFTISNGGVYGSMLSTPIVNPPQSGILGMHNIIERPMAVNGEVVIRPIMYLALSYDHRIVDGREAVTFLVGIKQALEDPARMLIEV